MPAPQTPFDAPMLPDDEPPVLCAPLQGSLRARVPINAAELAATVQSEMDARRGKGGTKRRKMETDTPSPKKKKAGKSPLKKASKKGASPAKKGALTSPAKKGALTLPAKKGALTLPAKKGALTFPGVPTKPRERLVVGKYYVYTDVKSKGWRVKEQGQRQEKKFSWKVDPVDAWARLRKHVK